MFIPDSRVAEIILFTIQVNVSGGDPTVWNKHTPTFGLRSYYGLKRLKFYYVHKFAHFKGLRLFFLSNFPEAMFIQEATFTPDSRIGKTLPMAIIVCLFDFLLLVIQIFIRNIIYWQ